MFDDIDVVCRAAACLTQADGRKRFVYRNGSGPAVSMQRPKQKHTELWRSADVAGLVMGTSIRPCPRLHPAAIYGRIFQEADGRWVRDWYGKDHQVAPLDVDGDTLIALQEETPAMMVGGEIVTLAAGFVVRTVRTFQVGADVLTLLEDGDGNEFIVPGRM